MGLVSIPIAVPPEGNVINRPLIVFERLRSAYSPRYPRLIRFGAPVFNGFFEVLKMRKIWFLSFVVIAVLCGISGIAFRSHAEGANLRGEYVEARTASVFAGACHYNGELTTAGRDALMAWNVKSGEWRGIDLAGVRIVAIVSADVNLADTNAARRSEIIIGENASDAQSRAMLEALKSRYAVSLGKIISVRRGP